MAEATGQNQVCSFAATKLYFVLSEHNLAQMFPPSIRHLAIECQIFYLNLSGDHDRDIYKFKVMGNDRTVNKPGRKMHTMLQFGEVCCLSEIFN